MTRFYLDDLLPKLPEQTASFSNDDFVDVYGNKCSIDKWVLWLLQDAKERKVFFTGGSSDCSTTVNGLPLSEFNRLDYVPDNDYLSQCSYNI